MVNPNVLSAAAWKKNVPIILQMLCIFCHQAKVPGKFKQD